MKTKIRTLLAVASMALVAGAAQAAVTNVDAHIDGLSDVQSRSDGGLASASVGAGSGSASAFGNLTSLHVIGTDTAHWSTGAPQSAALSDFIFELQGAVGLVDLTFNFVTTGGATRDELSTFTSGGDFGLLLTSNHGLSPYVTGNFSILQGFGSRAGTGHITTFADYYDPGSGSTVVWEGANPGNYSLHSNFLGGAANEGQLRMSTLFGGGNSSYDFLLNLASITTSSGQTGLSIYNPETGTRFAVTSLSAVPEPAAWTMMIAGFAMIGVAARRRRERVA